MVFMPQNLSHPFQFPKATSRLGDLVILEPATTLLKMPAELTPQAATPFVILWQVEVSTSKACTLGLVCTICRMRSLTLA